MFRIRRKLLSCVLMISLLLSGGSTIFAPKVFSQETIPGINLMLDGVYLDIPPEAQPVILNDSLFVPLGLIMDALGADYSFEAVTQGITAQRDGKILQFYLGSTTMLLQPDADSEVQSIVLPGAPTLIHDRTMVPLRAISEAFDLSVSWDQPARTVVLIDFAQLQTTLDTNFSVLNKLLDTYFNSRHTYATTGTYTEKKLTGTPGKEALDYHFASDVNLLSQGLNFNLVAQNDLNYSDQLLTAIHNWAFSLAGKSERQDLSNSRNILRDFQTQIIYNENTQTLFFNSSQLYEVLPQLMVFFAATNQNLDANTWIMLDFAPTFDLLLPLFLDNALVYDQQPLTLGSVVRQLFDYDDYYDVASYEILTLILDLGAELLSNQAFTVTGTKQQPTYTLQLNRDSFNSGVRSTLAKHPNLTAEVRATFEGLMLDTRVDFALESAATLVDPETFTSTTKFALDFDATTFPYFNPVNPVPLEPEDTLIFEQLKFQTELEVDWNCPGESNFSLQTRDFSQRDGEKLSILRTCNGAFETGRSDKKVEPGPLGPAQVIPFYELFYALFSSAP